MALPLASCAEDSISPPSTEGAAGTTTAPILDKLRLTADGKSLIGPAGKRIPIDPKQVVGYVDAATQSGDFLDLSGWVAVADFSAPADGAAAIAGEKSVFVVPTVGRPDVADGYKQPRLEASGFGMSVPISALDCSAPRQGLQTFAVTQEAAAPMKWLSNVGQIVRDACRS